MIPAQLLGNMWAQEWGNIYDIVAPPSRAATYDSKPHSGDISNASSTDHRQHLEAAKRWPITATPFMSRSASKAARYFLAALQFIARAIAKWSATPAPGISIPIRTCA